MPSSTFGQLSMAAGFCPALGAATNGPAQTGARLTAGESDPKLLGWMQGVPPAAAVESIVTGGDKEAFAKGYKGLRGGSYRGTWWVYQNMHGAFAARGVHGQKIYLDPSAEMVIVRFASHPVASNSANDATSLPAFQAVAEHMMHRP